jgi:hypothetical protein
VNAAAARASIATLLRGGSLERVPVDEVVVGNLLRQAANHLRTASAGVEADDPEGAFQLAYDACRKTCLALVMASGLRPKGFAAHVITFEAAAAVVADVAARRVVTEGADLRFVRHGAEYRAEAVGVADAHDAIAIGDELITVLTPVIDKILSGTGSS